MRLVIRGIGVRAAWRHALLTAGALAAPAGTLACMVAVDPQGGGGAPAALVTAAVWGWTVLAVAGCAAAAAAQPAAYNLVTLIADKGLEIDLETKRAPPKKADRQEAER